MNDLPEGWTNPRLDEIALINPRHPKTLNPSLKVSFVPMPHLREADWRLNISEQRTLGEVVKGYTHFADGDVLFAKITPCMENGKAAVAMGLTSGLGCGTTELHIIRPLDGIDPMYVYHFLHQEKFRREAAMSFTGSAGQLRVPMTFIQESRIPLAPPNEQRRIVAKLEEILGQVEACQKRLAKVPVILKRFRQSVLAAAFRGRLTADWRETQNDSQSVSRVVESLRARRKRVWQSNQTDESKRSYREAVSFDPNDLPMIPNTWEWTSADSVCSQITDGEHIQPPYQSHGRPMLTAKHVRNGYVIFDNPGYIKETDFRKCLDRCAPDKGDILIVSVGATTGRAAIVEDCPPFAIVRSVLLLKPLLDSRCLLRWIQSPWCLTWMKQASGASAQPHLYINDTKGMPVPIAPLAEQQEIVRRVAALFNLADQIEARYKKAQARVNNLTQSILAEAFQGELVPTEAELARREGRDYEPASALLERVRARHDTANESKGVHTPRQSPTPATSRARNSAGRSVRRR